MTEAESQMIDESLRDPLRDAAPYLLAALEAIVQVWGTNPVDETQWITALNEARAAIAEAKGETP